MNNGLKGYGFDRLSRDMLIASVALGIAAAALWSSIVGMALCFVSALLGAVILLRSFSTRVERRQDELLGYERVLNAIVAFFAGLFGKKQDKGYKYFKCPGCGGKLRAPKGKGHIRVTCPKCGNQFERKT